MVPTRLIHCFVLFFLMSFSAASFAEVRVGFVDIPFLIDKAPQAIEASARLEAQFAPRQQSLKEQRDELNELKKEFEKESLVMSPEKRVQAEQDIRSFERKLNREQQDFREELNLQKNNEFKKVRAAILKAISTFAEKEKFDVILNEGVLYASKRIDITEGILKLLESAQAQTPSSSQTN